MLGNHLIAPVLLATDLAATREFYHEKLGLQIAREDENGIVFKCGGSTRLDVTKSTVGTADQQTQAAWQVSDIRAEVAEPRARGVKVEDYETRGLRPKTASPTPASPGPPGSSTQQPTPSASSRSRSGRVMSGACLASRHGRRAPERAVLGGQRPCSTRAEVRADRMLFVVVVVRGLAGFCLPAARTAAWPA